ncbi:MAG: hypothetical protein KDD62_16120, partial [Bdellovibrionales bacterium]|nr:hypothetical protein [Bdellovibrionales bacterium]
EDFNISDLYASLVADRDRSQLIIDDLVSSLEEGRSPLLLTERTAHLEYFEKELQTLPYKTIVLRGGMGKKQRKAAANQIAESNGQQRVILATGRYIGEGFDDSKLDTLFLAMPVSWTGTLQQYVGRLHRLHDQKKVVQVYDYVDHTVPQLQRMFQRRIKGYKSIGYRFVEPAQNTLFAANGV